MNEILSRVATSYAITCVKKNIMKRKGYAPLDSVVVPHDLVVRVPDRLLVQAGRHVMLNKYNVIIVIDNICGFYIG